VVEVKELLGAGVHFGHPVNRWNPKMARYIFGARSKVYIIDLQKTVRKFKEALDFVKGLTASGGSILFVGTKRQAQAIIEAGAKESGMFYVNQRWLGGMLTNFTTIRKSVDRLKALELSKQDGTYERLTKKEVSQLEKERLKLDRNLSGIRKMDRLPGAVFIVDILKERICVAEARRLKIPVIALVDTNCDPDEVDYVIPGNDDGVRSIQVVTQRLVEAIMEGIALRQVTSTPAPSVLTKPAPETDTPLPALAVSTTS
jgi:small subunit ribosomal protein S2